jgi:hypothetical protein
MTCQTVTRTMREYKINKLTSTKRLEDQYQKMDKVAMESNPQLEQEVKMMTTHSSKDNLE